MSGFLDSAEIEIPCEKCGRKIKKSIGWIKTNNHLTCTCGTRITLKADQFCREIANVERGVDDLKKAINKIGKH